MFEIDGQGILSRAENLKCSIVADKERLKAQKEKNEVYRKATDKYTQDLTTQKEIQSYMQKLKTLLAVCNKKAEKFTVDRISLVEKTVEDNLRYVFPEEDFKVKFDMGISKTGRETCRLLLGKGNKYSATSAQNGRFVRQLISVVVVYTLNYLRGADTMYLDEALASSDKDNLTKLKPLLDRMREDGTQVILIEHKPELYNNVDRRQFELRKDRVAGFSSIVNVRDIIAKEEVEEL